MEEVIIEETTKIKKYKATDGTLFINRDECKKYEQTAQCVIDGRFFKVAKAIDKNVWDLFRNGNEDDILYVVDIKDKSIYEDVKIFLNYYHGSTSHWVVEFTEEYIGQKLLFYTNFDRDCYWYISETDLRNNVDYLFNE